MCISAVYQTSHVYYMEAACLAYKRIVNLPTYIMWRVVSLQMYGESGTTS
jgi:hypothetical protein